MEPESPLSCSQESSTGPYCEFSSLGVGRGADNLP
jgi:hypothetical protein